MTLVKRGHFSDFRCILLCVPGGSSVLEYLALGIAYAFESACPIEPSPCDVSDFATAREGLHGLFSALDGATRSARLHEAAWTLCHVQTGDHVRVCVPGFTHESFYGVRLNPVVRIQKQQVLGLKKRCAFSQPAYRKTGGNRTCCVWVLSQNNLASMWPRARAGCGESRTSGSRDK